MVSAVHEEARLDLAYKYPFSSEAKAIIAAGQQQFDVKALGDGRSRVQDALDKSLEFVRIPIASIKLAHLTSYVYARMVVSSLKSVAALNAYAESEAHRSAEALLEGDEAELVHITEELGIRVRRKGELIGVAFEEYASRMPRSERFSLSRQLLDNGIVYMSRETAVGFLEAPIKREILKGLPIPARDMPKEVAEYAKAVKLPVVKTPGGTGRDAGRYGWVEKLLANPIPDVRHRSVNLIFAPYFVNVKGLSEEDAVKAISDYIERCRQINPDTKINVTYIRYQCRYAKEKGIRPLSLEKAKGLIGMYVDI